MASWQFEQFVKITKSGKIEPFYIFLGEEVYLVEEALKVLKSEVFKDGGEDFNLDIYDANSIEMETVAQALETLPMMSARRLIIVKRAHELNTNGLEELSNMMSVPIDTACLVVLFESMDQRKKISKDLLKKATVIDFSPPHEKTIPTWIQNIAQKYDKKISLKDAHILKETVGTHLLDLSNEIQKLAAYTGERTEIQADDIEKIVSKTKLDSIFELTKAIGEKNLEKSLKIQKYLLDQGESEVGILAMVTRHIRILLLTQEALIKRMSSQSVSAYIGVPPFFTQSYVDQAKMFSRAKLLETYKELLKTDRHLKSSPISGEIYLNHLLMNVLS